MWKAALFLLVVVVGLHFAAKYVRSNPLDPVVVRDEVVVDTHEHEVRLAREGPIAGTYLVTAVRSTDWTDEPANVALSLIGFAETREYLRANPQFHRYGSLPGLQLENASATFWVIAANRLSYGKLRGLIDLIDERARQNGERVCITIAGDSLRVTGASALSDGADQSARFVTSESDKRVVFVNEISVEDCAAIAGTRAS
jgi:hypothetical protein